MKKTAFPSSLIAGAEVLRYEQDGYEFKELTTEAELREAFRLRYRFTVVRLRWVEGDATTEMEIDQYDPYSYHFGVIKDGILIAYMRMTPEANPEGIMSRNHFQNLWHKDPAYPVAHTADISRLFVERPFLKDRTVASRVLTGLYRMAYARSVRTEPEIRYWYFITSKRLITALKWRLGFPVKTLGHAITSDGKRTYAAAVSLGHARRRQRIIAPRRFRHFTSL